MKLERYGAYRLVRPEAEAIWRPALPEKEWKAAHAVFRPAPEENGGHWDRLRDLPERWQMEYHGLKLWAQTSASRHIGIFPEQASGWDWIMNQVAAANRPARVLNLFGYTGIATLAATKAGARVTHVDASKKTIALAQENQRLSHLEAAPIRWIVDDALKFVRREARRGTHYDGIILDPPKFGRGPKGEVWEFFDVLPVLLLELGALYGNRPLFLIITAYAIRSSALTLYHAVQEMMNGFQGTLSGGELVAIERSGGRQISLAIYTRWSASGAPK